MKVQRRFRIDVEVTRSALGRPMTRLLLLVALLAPAAARADEWRTRDTVAEAVCVAALLADYSTTLAVVHHPDRWHETNPLLGRHPSAAAASAYFGASIAAHALVSRLLPHPYRDVWQFVTLTVEAGYVASNISAGVRFELP